MRIGELAAASGVSVRALRYYEEQGLLSSERTAGGQRSYSGGAVDRIRMIQQLYAAGLSSKAILPLMPCVDTGRSSPEILDRLRTERARVEHQITELTAARDRLDDVIDKAVRYYEQTTAAA
jgi:DNA-binding transcriptional MerR regulator